jgi:hypothetical protein
VSEISLGDYTGYLFLELLRAREMADAYSRSIARRYADDEVLRFFSVPRYTVPTMELTIPVLISSAHFSQVVRFDYPVEEFVAAIMSRADDVRATVELARNERLARVLPLEVRGVSDAVERLAHVFHEELAANPDPLHPHGIVKSRWAEVFRVCLAEADLLDFYEKYEPSHALLHSTTDRVVELVLGRTVVDRTAIDDLLVDPETNVVKNGSSPTSVFTIRADLREEAFFLRSMRDDETGVVTPIVEFE